MPIPEYEYPIEQCDVPEVRREALREYRAFRRKCLEYLRGDSDTSVSNQVHSLAWNTVVFRTLNEARRIEPSGEVNGAMWELISVGYAHIMSLGIRKLVDRDPRTDSVWNVIAQVEKRPELLRRENFVCYDGIPFDSAAAQQRYVASLDMSKGHHIGWLSTKGPAAWGTSEILHKAFDALTGYPKKRKPLDLVDPSIVNKLKERLSHPSIERVLTMADRIVAHAERIGTSDPKITLPTLNEMDEALRIIVRVANFLSSHFFYDAAFGSVVPTPQFDVLHSLDKAWIKTENLPKLHEYWRELSNTIDDWAYNTSKEFIPEKPIDL